MKAAFIGGEHPSSSVASALLTGGEEIFSVRYLIIIVIEAECEAYSGA